MTDPEPLPAGHALWQLQNVVISPHVAGDSPRSVLRAYALAGEQIRKFAAGQSLANRVEPHLLT